MHKRQNRNFRVVDFIDQSVTFMNNQLECSGNSARFSQMRVAGQLERRLGKQCVHADSRKNVLLPNVFFDLSTVMLCCPRPDELQCWCTSVPPNYKDVC